MVCVRATRRTFAERTAAPAFTLVEILGAMSLLAILLVLIGPATLRVLDQLGREPARMGDFRLADDLLDQIGRDVRAATTMPESAGDYHRGEDTLILHLADGRLRAYRMAAGGVEVAEQRPGKEFAGAVRPLPIAGRFESVHDGGGIVAVRVQWELVQPNAGPIPLRATFAMRSGGRP